MCRQTLEMNSTYQNMKTSLINMSLQILSFQVTVPQIQWPFQLIFSTLLARIFLEGQKKPAVGLYLTFKYIPNAISSVIG
jgi:hypothetical protein